MESVRGALEGVYCGSGRSPYVRHEQSGDLLAVMTRDRRDDLDQFLGGSMAPACAGE